MFCVNVHVMLQVQKTTFKKSCILRVDVHVVSDNFMKRRLRRHSRRSGMVLQKV